MITALPYSQLMDFEWDGAKDKQNKEKHGVSFEYVTRAWLDPYYLEWQDTRKNYGEARFIRLALIGNYLYFVSFTHRLDIIRLISARRANKKEKKIYEAA
jgi:hypothetical protein